MTKKVKNASQSGTSLKPNKVTPAANVNTTSDADVSFDVAVVEAVPVPMKEVKDTEVENITVLDVRGKYPRPALTDEPVLEIAGQVIELTEIDKDETQLNGIFPRGYYSNDNILSLHYGREGRRGHHLVQTLSFKDARVWKATVNGVDIYMTQGSSVIAEKGLSGNGNRDPWDVEAEIYTLTTGQSLMGRRKLVIIGSRVIAETIDVDGLVVINNSTVSTKCFYAINSNIGCSNIYTDKMVELEASRLFNGEYQGNNRLHVKKSTLGSMVLGGFDTIRLNGADYDSNQDFGIALYSTAKKVNLRIKDIRLTPFSASFNPRNNLDEIETGGPYNYPEIIIERRVDYGYFSGIEAIPHVRIGETDLLVGNHVHTTKELSPHSYPPEEPKESSTSAYPGGQFAPSFPRLNTYHGYTATGIPIDKTWLKARETLVGYRDWNGGKDKPLGRTGERLVDTLVEQIKSRNNLYIELSSLVK